MNIFVFNDPVDYLEAYFADLKQNDPQASVRKWSLLNGMDSQDALFEILKRKKKISLNLISLFSNAFKFTPAEEKFFETLVLLSRAGSNQEIKLFNSLLIEQRGAAGLSVTLVEESSIFSNWIHMVILSMSKLKSFHCTPETIQETLMEDVSLQEIEEAIERLLNLNLIKYDEAGSLKKVHTHTTSKNDITRRDFQRYYEQVNSLAKNAIALPVEDREFQCFSTAIRQEDLAEFKEAIRQFRFKMGAMTPEDAGNQVYQFNVQFFPLSTKVGTMKQIKNSNEQISVSL